MPTFNQIQQLSCKVLDSISHPYRNKIYISYVRMFYVHGTSKLILYEGSYYDSIVDEPYGTSNFVPIATQLVLKLNINLKY